MYRPSFSADFNWNCEIRLEFILENIPNSVKHDNGSEANLQGVRLHLWTCSFLCVCLSVCLSATIVSTGHNLAKIKKNVKMKFADFDICYRMMSLQKLYYVTLTYFLKVKHFKICIYLKR